MNQRMQKASPRILRGFRMAMLLLIAGCLSVSNLMAQELQIRGQVKDELGNALPGVNVVVKRTGKGVTTDLNGRYAIAAVVNDEIEFSFVGKASKAIQVKNGETVYNLVLSDSNDQLEDVVVTALGIKREQKALGYSVQSLPGDGLQTVKGIDIGTSLTGKVAGLLVKNSTEFGAEPDVQIRGEKPLLVIDGVPYGNMTLRDIPSDDIESISVLKGATASALYGYRGAGGAIMVTTKRGSAKKGLDISVNSSTMFASGFLAIPKQQTTYGRVVNTATNTYARTGDGSWGVPMDGRDVIQWDPISKSMKSMPYLPIGANNFKNFLEPGYILNNNVSVLQQGELGSFRASAHSRQAKEIGSLE